MSEQPPVLENHDPTVAGPATSTETKMADKDQRLSTVFQIAKILATQQDLETALSRLLSCVLETLGAADAGIVLFYDSSDGWLKVKAAQGYNLSILKQVRLTPGESMSGKVFQTGQAELYSTPEAIATARANITPANREIIRAATMGRGEALSAICIPLVTNQTHVGVLVLESRHQPGRFNHADLDFLQHMADLMALSIENAHLREELQSAQALSEANRLKAELISTLAHEMRTPLTSIKGYSTALLMEETSFAPEI